MKTQLRFNHDNVEILTKTKGSMEPYKPAPHDRFCDHLTIPDYDHGIAWVVREDKPARRNSE